MSTFEFRIRKIEKLEPHPNAERLECVVVGGFKAVVAKGVHSLGDLVLYVPTDALFTDIEVAKILLIDSYLTGKNKNRVKAVKLRGLLSEGIVIPSFALSGFIAKEVPPPTNEDGSLDVKAFLSGEFLPQRNIVEGDDWADVLKIEKYEEPIPIEMAGQVRRWPSVLPKYDLENIKRPESMGLLIAGEPVAMTEKLHGTNMTIAIGEGLEEGEDVFVCSRNNALKESDTNVYWRAALDKDEDGHTLIDKIKVFTNLIRDLTKLPANVSFHGEVVGVQDLKYGMSGGKIAFYLFDIMIDGVYLDHAAIVHHAGDYNIPMVPVLYEGPYDYDELVKVASGKTTLGADHIREGGVVRPIKERVTHHGDRVVLKVISDAYLLRKNGSELH